MLKITAVISVCGAAVLAGAADLDTIGITQLRQADPTLIGSGVRVAQAEGEDIFTPNSPFPFEVNPSVVGQPVSLFTWYSISNAAGATSFPNGAGSESYHANSVAGNFYGSGSTAPGVSHVDNYDADFFANNKILANVAIPAAIVNQSFLFDATDQAAVDPAYDNYAAAHSTLFVNGAGNGGSISTNPPATTYNGITVGVCPGTSSYGPTSDGRSKPDITAPGSGVTSFSTPYVAGSAAILWQAGARNDGGAGTANVATNSITIKALLLNGAIKPADWTNGPVTPLDARYGAGVLNVFNSWNQLKGGRRAAIETNSVPANASHPPGASTNNEASLVGWDCSAITNSSSQDLIKHYYFNLTGNNPYTFTATLVWKKHQNKSAVNNLDLFLFRMSDSNLVLCSTSAVDNVEHLFAPQLAPGRYDLQVLKHGTGQVTTNETYALAFEFFSMNLNMTLSNGVAVLSWTNIPVGFRLVSTPSLALPSTWTDVNSNSLSFISIAVTNNQNIVSIPLSSDAQFFRLQRP